MKPEVDIDVKFGTEPDH